MQRIAHRGLWGGDIPENSMAGFKAAAARGLGIELDVHLSQDGVPIVFHDADLTRLTGHTGRIYEVSAEALQSMALVTEGTRAETIPILADVLAVFPSDLPVLIEIKPPHPDGPWDDLATANAVLDVIEKHAGAKVSSMSFSAEVTKRLVQRLPLSRVGYLAAEGVSEPVQTAKAAKAGFAAVWREDVATARDILGRDGPALYTWTIKSEAQQKDVSSFVDGVIFEGF